MEEAATGSEVNICSVLYQQLHTLQAPLLYSNMQRTVAAVELISALGVDKGLRIAGILVNLQQGQDAGIDPILKIQHSLHQARLPRGALCKERRGRHRQCSDPARLDHLPVCTANLGSRVSHGRI